ncbi:hypothetical protein SAZ10_00495 [Mesorhizobium sp. BAC0120]|uniref:hypothetical protein n=1 Tax=Mesorhizobium sp. BAC0120 TaxID=3090670 RepID=UPI00298D5C2C|nr:hypothetical protein [Mesorhizobium sp. BAC0120]MDW6020234.1 hypothetical protein [Mesorhizobium sp. BAC0120]
MGKSTKTTQENKPPAWAEPLLKQAAGDAQNLYNQGVGYHTYTGPTQAGYSDPTLSGMNSLLAATGYSGPKVTNQSWQNTPEIQAAQQLLTQQAAAKSSQQTRAAQPDQKSQPLWVLVNGQYERAVPMDPRQAQANNIRNNTMFRGGR